MALVIRNIREDDCQIISDCFKQQGWNKSVSQYRKYYSEQMSGKRTVLVAFTNDDFAGYLTIVWTSDYPYFKQNDIPEIIDLNVLKKYWRRGIANRLMDKAENLIAQKSNQAGIGVGLIGDYGPAQILYLKRGYIPDGKGISQNEKYLNRGDKVTVDDDLILCLTKNLV